MSVAVYPFDPLRDKSYETTTLGPDIAAFLEWARLGGMSDRTCDQYERDLSKGALMFPAKGPKTLEDNDAIHIAGAFKTGERRVRVAAWNSFYKFLLQTRRAERNPFTVLPTIKRQPQDIYDIFDEGEYEALCSHDPLLAIMLETGARKGDCRNLQLRDFVLEPAPGAFRFNKGKGGKSRLVPATMRAAQSVSELALTEGLSPVDYLWYSVRANEISRKKIRNKAVGEGTFARWWRQALEEAGVRYRNPHMTRHTFATRWLRRGGRLETLSLVMGHASIRTTFDLYGHLDTTDVLADLAVIEGRA